MDQRVDADEVGAPLPLERRGHGVGARDVIELAPDKAIGRAFFAEQREASLSGREPVNTSSFKVAV